MNRAPTVRELFVKRLNTALIDEIVRVRVRGRAGDMRCADLIAEKIVELGGAPDYSSLRPAPRRRATARI